MDSVVLSKVTKRFGSVVAVDQADLTVIEGELLVVLGESGCGKTTMLRLIADVRAATPDVVTLCLGTALMLVWAGLVESFFSQYHEPVLPYALKISFGVVEFVALAWYLFRSGLPRESRIAGAEPKS